MPREVEIKWRSREEELQDLNERRESERQSLLEQGCTYRVATALAYGYDPGPNAEPEDEDSFYDDSEELGEFLDPDYEEYFERCMERD